MINTMATVLITAALLLAGWALVLVIRNREMGWFLLGALGLLELGLLAQLVIGVLNVITTDREVSTATLLAYLIGSLFILPVAAVWSLAERTRWGTSVLIVGCLAITVMVLRMQQIWDEPGV